ncbi:HPr family phosphocarrier protein [Paraburkholderia sp. LEh10]|uniref:HPr family phosphocarrier protein n=1 Tax=Paraburkholderia sp. LEh10 TaxID=2821353 RepID=UPI0028B0F94F|nr:HPr family phosphocarrier protein [Paraburkholderia sp. LEh10]
MVDVVTRVKNRQGLDAQESARISHAASTFSSDIVCVANGRAVNGKDVMSVMALRARQDTPVRLLATGRDECVAVQVLSDVLCTSESGSTWNAPSYIQ